jgi:hypothetical protein
MQCDVSYLLVTSNVHAQTDLPMATSKPSSGTQIGIPEKLTLTEHYTTLLHIENDKTGY